MDSAQQQQLHVLSMTGALLFRAIIVRKYFIVLQSLYVVITLSIKKNMVHVYRLYMHHSFRLHTICNTLLVQRCVNVECTAQFLNQQCWREIYIYISEIM